MKIKKFLIGSGLVLAAALMFSPGVQATMRVSAGSLENRVLRVGENGMIVTGVVQDAVMVQVPIGQQSWVGTECTIEGVVIKGSDSFGYQASENTQSVKVKIFGYGSFGIRGNPTCQVGMEGMHFFYGPHPVTGLSSYAFGPEGQLQYVVNDKGQQVARDAAGNATMNFKSRGKGGKALSANAEFNHSIKALTAAQEKGEGLPVEDLQEVVRQYVNYYYPPQGKGK